MASLAHTARSRRPMVAWAALLKAELLNLSRSWVLRGWLVALALTEAFGLAAAVTAGRGANAPGSTLLALYLASFLFVWSLVVIVVSAGSVSLETEVVSDSILSRACTRTEYIAAKIAALVLVISVVYLLGTGIAAVVSYKYAANDMTLATMATGIGIVWLAVLFLVALGVAVSVVCNNTVFAVIALLLLWYVAPAIYAFLGADYLSPASLARNLPAILRDTRAPQVVQVSAASSSVTVLFSKDVAATGAETLSNYTVESPPGTTQTPATATYDADRTSVQLAGLDLEPGEEVEVTVTGVTDRGGSPISPAADTATATVPEAPEAEPQPKNDPPTAARSEAGAETPGDGQPEPARPARPATRRSATRKPVSARGDTAPPRVTGCTATASSLRVTFSEPLDAKGAEKLANYTVENPPGTIHEPRSAAYTPSTRTVTLSGLTLDTASEVKVTVKDVKDLHENRIRAPGDTASYSDVTTWHYVLGFGLPALAAGLLAVAWFSRRDL